MSATMLNRGVYDGAEAARLLGVSPSQVIRWATPSAPGLAPVVAPMFDRAFSFTDLVALRVASDLHKRGVSDHDLRHGVAHLRGHFGTDHPLADKRILDVLATSGASFLAELGDGLVDIGRGRQGAFESVVRLYLRSIEFNGDGKPDVWRPPQRVVLDPRVQAGAPCLAGTRVPTATIAGLLDGESAEDIAADFGIRVEDVQIAACFEDGLVHGLGLAA
jgi:uncharacterized protein (DUF433 family)